MRFARTKDACSTPSQGFACRAAAFAVVFFGNAIWRSQKYFIPTLSGFKNVLILGGGTGKILVELMKHKTGQHYFYVDLSDKMILKTKKRIQKQFI